MDKKINTAALTTATTAAEEKHPIRLEDLCFAATCESCAYYAPDDSESGWCRRHGGWVSPDKWSCSNYA